MTTAAAAAANAYATLSRLADPASALGKVGASGGAGEGSSFGALLKDALGAVVEAGHKADIQQQAVANGKANIVDVVNSVNAAELTLDTVVAVRDKVVAAYQSIMNMPI